MMLHKLPYFLGGRAATRVPFHPDDPGGAPFFGFVAIESIITTHIEDASPCQALRKNRVDFFGVISPRYLKTAGELDPLVFAERGVL